ncbi:hypothetical protein PM082_003781 [Marasmius tenuissimus]|nr:hypothetical protein PM082_003781 [Marasmius tenuissimus]
MSKGFESVMKMLMDAQNAPSTPPKQPKYVKLKPGDNGWGLLDVFYDEDPRDWKPKRGPNGEIHSWGLFKYSTPEEPVDEEEPNCNIPNVDNFKIGHRKMGVQMLYLKDPSPEEQFVKALIDRKVSRLMLGFISSLTRMAAETVIRIGRP